MQTDFCFAALAADALLSALPAGAQVRQAQAGGLHKVVGTREHTANTGRGKATHR